MIVLVLTDDAEHSDLVFAVSSVREDGRHPSGFSGGWEGRLVCGGGVVFKKTVLWSRDESRLSTHVMSSFFWDAALSLDFFFLAFFQVPTLKLPQMNCKYLNAPHRFLAGSSFEYKHSSLAMGFDYLI
jgi:hypothetical protein